MQAQIDSFDPRERALEKRRSRAADERALAEGRKSVADLKRENEVFAPLMASAKIDLSASRSLS